MINIDCEHVLFIHLKEYTWITAGIDPECPVSRLHLQYNG